MEGRWSTGGGVGAADLQRLVRAHGREATVTLLTSARYWGRAIDDERYLLLSSC